MPLPLFPIGTEPTGITAREASKRCGVELYIVIILIFLQIEDRNDNECNPLLTVFLDMLVLIGLDTIIAANAPVCPPGPNRQPALQPCPKQPLCPENPNPPPSPGKCEKDAVTVCAREPEEAPEDGAEPESRAQAGEDATAGAVPGSPRKSCAPVQ